MPNFVHNWPTCAEFPFVHRINELAHCEILQIIVSNIALSLALTVATASTKHFGTEVIKYFAVMCINAAVTGVTMSNCNKFSTNMRSVTSVIM